MNFAQNKNIKAPDLNLQEGQMIISLSTFDLSMDEAFTNGNIISSLFTF